MKKRVGILGIYHESNTFLDKKTSFEDFEKGHLLVGEQICNEYAQAFHEIGGMLEGLKGSGIEPVPIMFAEATPGGVITADTLNHLSGKMFADLKSKKPLDGILVALHGAAVSKTQPDMDGWWLQKLRSLMRSETPIIGTLDPHANVTQKMVDATDALVAYKTNPHIDQRETGKKAARLMVKTLDKKLKPRHYFFQPPATISIEKQYTKASPCKELYKLADEIGSKSNIISISVILGFPYADVEEMGSGFLVVTDNNLELAESTAKKLGDYFWENRSDFIGEKISVAEAIASLEELLKPVLLLDMGDNVGGGSPGDSTFLLEGLEESGKWRSFVCIYDPMAVERASQCQPGSKIWLNIGGKTDHLHGLPYRTKVIVIEISDGVFKETKRRHGGQVKFNMGKIAIVETVRGTTVMLTSLRIAPFSLNQLTSFGIDPGKYDTIVAKGVHAPIVAYEEVCKSFIQVNTNGITQADMTKLPFLNRRKPLYPFEK